MLCCILVAACGGGEEGGWNSAGNPHLGAVAIQKYGCPTCHIIPGIRGATGLVGPPLDHIASRVYLAGRITNTPHNMRTWIQHPRSIDEKTAMPELGVTDADADDITSYLLTLR